MADIDTGMRSEDDVLLEKICEPMNSKGTRVVLNIYGKNSTKELRGKWIAFYLLDYATKIRNKSIPIKNDLDEALTRRLTVKDKKPFTLIQNISRGKVRVDRSRIIFECLAKAQNDKKLIVCFLEFLEFCSTKNLQLITFDDSFNSKDFDENSPQYSSLNLAETIKDIKKHIAQSNDENKEVTLIIPYKGLDHFKYEDRDIFFGRDHWIDKVSTLVRKEPFTAVIGASGTGKSSLILAGVAPRLCEEENWKYIYLRIGFSASSDPFQALAMALIPHYLPYENTQKQTTQQSEVAAALRDGRVPLTDYIDSVRRHCDNKKLLLIVDQFEELFTISIDKEVRKSFINLILHTVELISKNHNSPACSIIITLRSDFLSHVNDSSSFAKLISDYDIIIPSLNTDELEQAIENPIKDSGISFEDGLVKAIINDSATSSVCLPLIEFALAELWKAREQDQISFTTYEKIGRVYGALTQRAEALYDQLSPADRSLVKHIFIKLISIGDDAKDTKRRARSNEFTPTQWRVIQQLSGESHRLLIVGNKEADEDNEPVEIAHEALIENWERLQGWLNEDRNFKIWQNQLRPRIKIWNTDRHDSDILLRGSELATARDYLENNEGLEDIEKEFVNTSIDVAEKDLALKKQAELSSQRGRRIRIALVTSLVMVLAISSFFLNLALKESNALKDIAISERNQAIINQHRFLADKSRELIDSGRTRQGILIALEVLKSKKLDGKNEDYVVKAINTLKKSLGKYVLLKRLKLDDGTNRFDITSDLLRLVSSSGDGHITIWNIESGEKTIQLVGHTNRINHLEFSKDDQLVLSASDDKTARIWNANTGEQIFLLTYAQSELTKMMVSKNGRYAITLAKDGKAQFWLLNKPKINKPDYWHDGPWADMELDSHNSIVWLSYGGVLAKAFLTSDNVQIIESWSKANVSQIELSNDSKLIATHSKKNTFETGKLENFGLSKKMPVLHKLDSTTNSSHIWKGSNTWINIKFSDKDSVLIVGGIRTVSSFDPVSGRKLKSFSIGKFLDGYSDISSDESFILTTTYGDKTHISDLHSGKEIAELLDTDRSPYISDEIDNLHFHHNGHSIIGLNGISTFSLWSRPKFLQNWVTLLGLGNKVNSINFSNNSSFIVTASNDKDIRIYDRENGELLRVLKGHSDEVHSASFTANDSKIISASADGTVRLWEVSTGRQLLKINIGKPVYFATFSVQGKHIFAAADHDPSNENSNIMEAFEFELKEQENHHINNNLTGSLKSLGLINHDTNNISFREVMQRFPDIRFKTPIFSPLFLKAPFFKINEEELNRSYGPAAISSDGSYSALNVNIYKEKAPGELGKNIIDRFVVVRNIISGKQYRLSADSKGAELLSFSEDSQFLVTVASDEALVWHSESGKNLAKFPVNSNEEFSAGISPDNRFFSFIEDNRTINIWNIESGKQVFSYTIPEGIITSINFSGDSKSLAWITSSGEVTVSPIQYFTTEQLVDFYRNLGLPSLADEERKQFHLQ